MICSFYFAFGTNKILYFGILAHLAGAYPSFHGAWSSKEYHYSLLDGMLVYHKVIPQHFIRLPCQYPIIPPGWREAWGKCLAKELNTLTQPGLDPRPLDQEHNALTIKPLGLATGTCASSLTLYTLTSVRIFSTLFFIHFLRYQQG